MRPIDISGLVKGITAIILLAIAIGQYDRAQSFATKEAIKAFKPWRGPNKIFPTGNNITNKGRGK
ncbi:MAG: hypothetical protein AB1540_07680 [Bdellovibrionota bacterium]